MVFIHINDENTHVFNLFNPCVSFFWSFCRTTFFLDRWTVASTPGLCLFRMRRNDVEKNTPQNPTVGCAKSRICLLVHQESIHCKHTYTMYVCVYIGKVRYCNVMYACDMAHQGLIRG